MQIKTNFFLKVFTLLTILAVGLGVWAFMHYTPPEILSRSGMASLIEMENVVLNGGTHSGREWVVKAAKVDISQDRATASVEKIAECVIFNGEKPAAKLKADNAVVNLLSRRMSIFGNVQITGDAGQSLETSAIVWEPVTSTLKSSSKVLYRSKRGDINAEQAEVNVNKNEITLVKPELSLWIENVGALK